MRAEIRLKRDAWQCAEIVTACEDESVIWLQPYFVLRGGFVDVDAVELRSLESSASRRRD